MIPLTLIDLSAEFWRNYFGSGADAIKAYELTIEKIEWYAREYPGATIVCCDSPRNIRKEKDPTYKAKRKPMPVDGIESIRGVQERVKQWGLPVASSDGYEADDVIATLVDQAWPRDVQIIGSEKDFFCLISDSVTLIGKAGPIDADGCVRKFGVTPDRMTELLALAGDASDGVSGCEGIGMLKAQAIFAEYSSIAAAKLAAQDGSMAIRGIGKTIMANLAAWDPEPCLAMIRLVRDVPISLESLLSGETQPEEFPADLLDIPF